MGCYYSYTDSSKGWYIVILIIQFKWIKFAWYPINDRNWVLNMNNNWNEIIESHGPSMDPTKQRDPFRLNERIGGCNLPLLGAKTRCWERQRFLIFSILTNIWKSWKVLGKPITGRWSGQVCVFITLPARLLLKTFRTVCGCVSHI